MQVYSSANWVYAIENPKGAYMNYTPTLFDISNVFGADIMVNWVATNVMAIWYVKPDNNPQIYDQAKAWAKMWSRMNKNYTIGELTLFFARCQAGKYFLGNRLDITRIGNVFEENLESIWRKGDSLMEGQLAGKYDEISGKYDEYYTFNF